MKTWTRRILLGLTVKEETLDLESLIADIIAALPGEQG